jgi:hypothetical protein
MTFGLIVIGSGPGGYVAAIRAAQLGMKRRRLSNENILEAFASTGDAFRQRLYSDPQKCMICSGRQRSLVSPSTMCSSTPKPSLNARGMFLSA